MPCPAPASFSPSWILPQRRRLLPSGWSCGYIDQTCWAPALSTKTTETLPKISPAEATAGSAASLNGTNDCRKENVVPSSAYVRTSPERPTTIIDSAVDGRRTCSTEAASAATTNGGLTVTLPRPPRPLRSVRRTAVNSGLPADSWRTSIRRDCGPLAFQTSKQGRPA